MVENKKRIILRSGLKYVFLLALIFLTWVWLNSSFFLIRFHPNQWTMIFIYVFYAILPTNTKYRLILFIPLVPLTIVHYSNIFLLIATFLIYSMYCTIILLYYLRGKNSNKSKTVKR